MVYITKILKAFCIAFGIVALSKLISLVKISYIVGTIPGICQIAAYFSFTGAIIPLAGMFGGATGSCGVLFLKLLLRMSTTGFHSLRLLAYHLPGFGASLYWPIDSFLFRVGVPIGCIITFLLHPVGWYAAPYVLFWLIPIGIFFLPRKNLFLHALASTFIAHAIGSVIWIYTGEMPVEYWYYVMLRVPFERCMMAAAMVGMYKAISILYAWIEKRIQVDGQTSCLHNGR